ncbi:MAG: hypothetical protein Q4C54_08615 [Clostridia bacterium]|nr:hypothetical protein [Clostridia bacterium]
MQYQLTVFQASHQGAREYQQDRIAATPQDAQRGMLTVLCDGMGGMKDGERFA